MSADSGRLPSLKPAKGTQEELAQIEAMAAKEFEALASSPDELEIVNSVFHRHLEGEITELTFEDLERAVAPYLSTTALGMVAWIAQSRADNVQAQIDTFDFSPDARKFVARLVALFGQSLTEAFSSSADWDRAHDWRGVNREILRDVLTGEYTVSVEIEKLNRERFIVRGNPGSIMRLTRLMLQTLAQVDDVQAFSDEDKERFKETLDELQALFGGSGDDAEPAGT